MYVKALSLKFKQILTLFNNCLFLSIKLFKYLLYVKVYIFLGLNLI